MKQIPNLFTLLNLFFGCIAIVFALQTESVIIYVNEDFGSSFNIPERLTWAAIMIGIAALIDFFDGFVARLLNATSPIGKQLDSLADIVSFGVAPAAIIYQLLRFSYAKQENGLEISILLLLPAFILSCAAAYRLAKFNLDGTQVFNLYKEALNRWHGAGTSNNIPRLTRINDNLNYRSSDLWIEKGDYLSLKNVSLGYTIPKWRIARADMPGTRVYVSCYHAFIITGYDGYTPELGYTDGNRQRGVDVAQYPPVRTFTIGATLNF